ncbi:MAG TPA: undecaprenyl-diphosphate phosphatase [Polyangiaceae bacterium]|nr:undecaprenyl-diphosphate phosphatase [Polyangiaceae bacterium]
MEPLLLLKALVLGIVEGLTEFLPISSTGHLILVGALLDFNDERGKTFEVVIQTGAMLAVIWEYRARFLRLGQALGGDPVALRFARNLLIAFLPAAVLGFLLSKVIKAYLFKPVPVAIAFVLGALVILWVERRERPATIQEVDELGPMDALKVGLAQAFALIPGTSRSGATIIGGMLFGLSRKVATEFSFFLAVPTLCAAGAYELFKQREHLHFSDLPLFGVGAFTSFVAAFLCVRWLIRFVATNDFRGFAWYRVAFGALILLSHYAGWVNWAGN